MERKRGKIIFIAGLGRSGSTIIDNILGQADGFFSAGEARDLWNQGCEEPCSCGKPLKDCDTWVKIFLAAYGREPAGVDFAHALRMSQRLDRLRHLWWLVTSAGRTMADRSGMASEYLEITRRLYTAIFEVSGAKVIVDSSKGPSHAYLLECIGLADLYVVHLTRDPRAVVFSWGHSKGKWPPKGLVRASMAWNANNFASEWLWGGRNGRYMRVNYEDFAEHPRSVMQSILKFAGEAQAELPFISENVVELRTLHGYGGTPGRYTGRIDIAPDAKWRSKMKLRQKLAATAITAPWLLRYGYPLNFLQSEAMQGTKPSGPKGHKHRREAILR
jgi:hypothetical protein